MMLESAAPIKVLAMTHFNPDSGRVEITVPIGASVAECVEQALQNKELRGRAVVTLVNQSGQMILRQKNWKHTRPKSGTRIVIRVMPGASAVGAILSLAVSFASSTFAAPLGSLLAGTFGLSGATWTTIASLGIYAVGSLIANALNAPSSPKSSNEKNSYSISGWRNRFEPDGAVPCAMGTTRYAPPFAAFSYAEIQGDDHYTRALFNCGYGPVSISDIWIGDTSIDEFDEVEIEIREGYEADEPVSLFPQQVLEEAINVELTRPPQYDDAGEIIKDADFVETPVVRVTASDAQSASVILAFTGGLVRFNDSGNKKPHEVEIRIEQRNVEAGDWELVEDLSIKANTTVSFFRQHSWDLPTRGRYEIRLTRMTDDDNDSQISDNVTFALLQSIRPEYPLNFTDGDLSLIAMRIKATHQISGQLDSVNCLVARICPDYDEATGEWITRATSNPASLYRYALQSPANPRPVADTGIDLERLETWHNFCRINDLKYDRVLDQVEMTLLEALSEIAVAGRASPRHDGVKWSVTVDEPQELVVAHLGPRNFNNFKSTRTYFRRPDAFRVTFSDATNDFEEAERLIPWPGHTGEITETEELSLLGKTDPDEIWTEARRRQYELDLRPEQYQGTQDSMNRTVTRGDLAQISHPIISMHQISARCTAVKGTLIELDEVLTIAEGQSYGVSFQWFNEDDTIGGQTVREVVANPGKTRVLRLIGDGDAPVVGQLVYFGLASNETIPVLVREVEVGDGDADILHLIDAAPEIDELLAQEAPPAWSSRVGSEIVIGTGVAVAPRFTSVKSGLEDTGVENRVEFLLKAGSDSVPVTSFQIDHRPVGGAWTSMVIPVANGGGHFDDYTIGTEIELTARSISGGLAGAVTPIITLTIGGDDALIPSQTFAPGATLDASLFDRSVPVLFYADFVGLNGATGGIIAELGDASNGFYAGFQADGSFLARCGKGGALPEAECASVTVSAGQISGDGRLTIVCTPGTPIEIQVFWQGAEVGTVVSGTSGKSTWSSSDDGTYLSLPTTALPVNAYEASLPTYSTASSLMVVSNYVP